MRTWIFGGRRKGGNYWRVLIGLLVRPLGANYQPRLTLHRCHRQYHHEGGLTKVLSRKRYQGATCPPSLTAYELMRTTFQVFSSMGAGAKCDPTRIQISDISYTIYDPLARSVRRRLRLQGVSSGIPVVYSTEVPGDIKLLPLPEEEFQKGDVNELGVFDDFRVRILPVLGW